MRNYIVLCLLLAGWLWGGAVRAQEGTPVEAGGSPVFSTAEFQALRWRNIGTFRGGRSVAVAGVRQQPMTFYMGSTGGGVWQTEDGGLSWRNISDGFFNTGSVGAIAVAPSDPNVIFVGMGEHAVRGNMTSAGDGVYKSTDGGLTWQHLGLIHSRHIAAIRIHPANPDIVYVAVQGDLFGPGKKRGVYRSTDGGRNWQQVLYINETTGACDLGMDINNPRILYAGMWDHQRLPWMIRSGGPGSGIYKSTDGGENWVKLNQGLPAQMGKVGIDVSPANSLRLYANIEAENGGVFRSDDGGRTWQQTNAERLTFARAWYYNEIVADPQDPETVYVLNAPLLRSIDGGRTFRTIDNPHSDQHALWINPDKPQVMILGNDGGATITFNGGKTWSTQSNQPTAQLYRIAADNRFPYTIYTAQQDYLTLAIPSQTAGRGIELQDVQVVGHGESAFAATDPNNPEKVFSSGYQGNIEVFDRNTRIIKDIMAYPVLGLATSPKDLKYRFNWNAPLIASPQQPGVLYHGANVVLQSRDGGQRWETISPDLTRNNPIHQGLNGGPFTNEGAGGETYNTISYLACAPQQAGVLWTGSDDGLVHYTQDNGKTWKDVTPPGLGEALIHCIEVSPHDPATVYLAVTRHKFNDLRPLIYKTTDNGKTWSLLVNGIGQEEFVWVVREDPNRPGLLFAGTERGLYLSFNGGQHWRRFQFNLPMCPVTDLTFRNNDLIAATSGRSLWILDDISSLQQVKGQLPTAGLTLFKPRPSVRFDAETNDEPDPTLGENPRPGVIIDYYLPKALDSLPLKLEILSASGQVLRTYSSHPERHAFYEGGPLPAIALPTRQGLNRVNWDLRRETLPGVPRIYIAGDYRGGLVAPGNYVVRLSTPNDTVQTQVELKPDPRLPYPPADYQEQEETLVDIETQVRDIHNAVNQMREVRDQINNLIGYLEKAEDCKELVQAGRAVILRINAWEKILIQPRQQTAQDVINFPSGLSAEFLDLKSRVDGPDPRVTAGAKQRLRDLKTQWVIQRQGLQDIQNRELASFKRIFREKDIPGLIIPAVNAF